MPRVEEQAGEHLVLLVAQARLEIVAHRLRALQYRIATQALGQVAPAHLQHGLQLRILGHAEPEMAAERGEVRLEQARSPPNSLNSRRDSSTALQPVTPVRRKIANSSASERAAAPCSRSFSPRPFGFGPIADAHSLSPSSPPAVPVRTLCYLSPSFCAADDLGGAFAEAHVIHFLKGKPMQRLYRKRIVLGVGGGIAAYKSAELVRRLRDQGAEVRVVMTQGGREFITP